MPTPSLHDCLPLAYKVARRYRRLALRAGLEVEDLVQEALLKLHQRAAEYDPSRGGAFTTFAWTVMRGHLWNLLDRAHPLPRSGHGEQEEDLLAGVSAPEASEPLADEDVGRLLVCLSERQRQVVELRFGLAGGETHTQEEIASDLGVSFQRVQQILGDALTRLRRRLEG
jgi:RNA polymerase sigma factor (sigma-70 family)